MTESSGDLSNITYDTTPKTVTIRVKDNGNGQLVADETDLIQTVEVTNTYDKPVDGEIKVTKKLEGRNWKDGDSFTFTLTALGGAPMPADYEPIIITDQTEKTASFGNITFTAAGTYVYQVSETQDRIGGVEYDTSEHYVVIVVERDASSGDLTGSEANPLVQTVEITNTYTPAPAEGEVKVMKTLSGREWKDGDSFTFTLSAADGTPMPAVSEITVTNGTADYTASFGKISFTEAGTYTYTVKETQGSLEGITYDTAEHTVTIAVVDDLNGKLTAAEGSNLIQTVEITNTYLGPVNGEVKVMKTLSGREWKNGDSFTFTLSAADGTPMPANTQVTVTNETADKTASFGEITFTEAGTYTYTVKETKGSIGGITYDETEHTVTIKVKDGGEGQLVADGTDLVQTVEITNTYKAAQTEGEILVEKVLEGREWLGSDSFTFTLAASGTAPMPEGEDHSVTITPNTADKTDSFGKITFTGAGTFNYTVTETKGDIKGITYDTTAHTVTIKVADDGNGNLVADTDSDLIQTVTVTNTYEAGPAEGEIKVTKKLEGRDWQSGDTFTFTLAGLNGAPMPANTQVTVTNQTPDKTASFGTITYAEVGTYVYTVTETKGTIAGITYDETPQIVIVTVTDDGSGTLKATIPAAEVTNVYTEPVEGEISAAKNLVGRDWKDTDEFTFTLTAVNGAPMPAGEASVTVKNSTAASFGKITFVEPGTYVYSVKETKGSIDGITYDESEHTVVIIVEKGADGKLAAASGTTLTPTVTITNTYTVTPVCVQFGGCKTFPGAPDDLKDTLFTYQLMQGSEIIGTSTTKGAGGYHFDSFIYNEPGTYTYTVAEKTDDPVEGIEYDTNQYNITVNVSKDETSGDLKADVAITDSEGNSVDSTSGLNFDNPFTASAEAYLQVVKALDGAEWPECAEVTFTLSAEDEKAPLPGKTTVTLTKAGTASFGAISYGIDEVGKTYKYTITESAEGFGQGWSVSPESIPVTVTISREGNSVKADVEYAEGNTVTNTYDEATIQFRGRKTLTGRRLKSGDFTFILSGSDGTYQAVTNRGSMFVFDTIWFTEVGEYTYTIREYIGSEEGITYDETVYTVTVNVSKDDKGKFVVETSGADVNALNFTNK